MKPLHEVPKNLLAQANARLERMAAEKPVLLAFLVFVCATLVVIPLSLPFYLNDTRDFWENILAEAHGTVFDLLIIGWFLMWLNRMAERRVRNNRYREEIEDYLGWKSPEATHRITGNVRRLNRGGVREKLRLTEAYLSGANLGGAHLKESDLWGAQLEGATLREANLSGASLAGANLDGADLERADLRDVDLRGASLRESDLERAAMEGADLRGAMLSGADLQYAHLAGANLERSSPNGANLRGADLREVNLRGANLQGANLRGAALEGATLVEADLEGADFLGANLMGAVLPDGDALLEQFATVRSLFGAKLDAEKSQALYAAYPALFELAHSQRSSIDV